MVDCYDYLDLMCDVNCSEGLLKHLEAFELWMYRLFLKISRVGKISNITVLTCMNKTIKRRKLEYFGHIMRHPEKYNLLHLIVEVKILGRRSS